MKILSICSGIISLFLLGTFLISDIYGQTEKDLVSFKASNLVSGNWNDIPTEIKLSKPNEVCQSGDCEFIVKEFLPLKEPDLEYDFISLNVGDLTIVDDKTNADLSPKKRELEESFAISGRLDIMDIKEETDKDIYELDGFFYFFKNLGDKTYWYDVKGTYEYPKGELILSGERNDR